MAIHRRVPICAALTDEEVVNAIETERVMTEKVVLAAMWGF